MKIRTSRYFETKDLSDPRVFKCCEEVVMKRKAEVVEEREMKIRLRKEGFHWSDFGFIFFRFGKCICGMGNESCINS